MTHFVGVVSVPRREQFAFRYIDFVPLDGQRVMAILVFADNDVQNRVIETRRAYDRSELERIAHYLNTQFAGRPLAEIRSNLLRDLRRAGLAALYGAAPVRRGLMRLGLGAGS